LVVAHWAHLSACDCDPWSEPESEWHRAWKEMVPPEQREVTMGPHRADIRLASGKVIELQHSPISPSVIAEREEFYGNMAWLFDGRPISCSPPDDTRPCECSWEDNDFGTRKIWTCDRCRESLQITWSQFGVRVHWKRQRKTWLGAKRPVFIDLGGQGVLQITRVGRGSVHWGRMMARDEFAKRIGLVAALTSS